MHDLVKIAAGTSAALLLAACLGEAPPRFPSSPGVVDTLVTRPDTVKPVYRADIQVDSAKHKIVVPGGSGKADTLHYSTTNGKLELSLPGGTGLVLVNASLNPETTPSLEGEWVIAPGGLPAVDPASPNAQWVSLGASLLAEVPLTVGFQGSELTVNIAEGYDFGARMAEVLDSALGTDVAQSGSNSVVIPHPTLPGVKADLAFKLEDNTAKLVFVAPGGRTCTFSQPLLSVLLGAPADAQNAQSFDACLQESGFSP